ncbi:MAG TPA: LuxR C-terminal-related transcriptional regulator, partial [Chloroflexota bacterium]
DEAVALAEAALQSAEHVDFAEAACEALEVIGRCARQQDLDMAEAPFAQAFQIADTHNLPMWRLRALHELGTIDMLRFGGVDRLEQARELAEQSGALAMVAILDLQLAAVHGFRFEPELGIAAARRCAAAARRLHLGVALPRALVQEAACQGFLGRKNEMEAAIREALALPEADLDVMIGVLGLCRGLHLMFQDRRQAALVELDRAMELVRRQPSVPPYLFRPLWALVRTVENTDGEVAQSEVRAADVAGVGLNRALLGYAHAVTLGRTGPAVAAATAFAEADDDLLAQGSCEAFRHLARRLVAEAALVDGWGEPVAWLRDAATFFEGTGHDRVVAACRSALRTAGVTTPRRGRGDSAVPPALRKLTVTSREMDVLVLVAERLSNKEIGARLYLSTRTVEKHVEQLLSKTNTHSRSELASALHRLGSD